MPSPVTLKSHSHGEYVFDHGWADAYEHAGGNYYPKLQVAVPFTPATGAAAAGAARRARRGGARPRSPMRWPTICRRANASSVHVTFLHRGRMAAAGRARLSAAHPPAVPLENGGYDTFDDFLAALASRKRKTIRREREDALANGITVHWLTGADLTESVWDAFFDFYMDTGSRKWGRPYLTREFYSIVGAEDGATGSCW